MKFETDYRAKPGHFVSPETLQRIAPAIFAKRPSDKMSDRYAFIPTLDVVKALQKTGMQPIAVQTRMAKSEEGREFVQHLLRFGLPPKKTREVGDVTPEVILINSHNGASGYQLHLGFFRLACLNGLVVCDSTVGRISVRHVGRDTADLVVDKSREIIEAMPLAVEQIDMMRKTILQPVEQTAFARAALALRWDPEERKEGGAAQRWANSSDLMNAPVTAERVLEAQRFTDKGDDLWRVFNRVQENITKGGQRGYAATGRRLTTKPIKALDKDVAINRGLWTLAVELAAHKAGKKSRLNEPVAHAVAAA